MSQAQTIGPILRIVGLVIEMIGVTILALSGRNDAADLGSRFGLSTNQIWAIVIVGFVIWAAGSVMIYTQRQRPRKSAPDDDRDDS
jgi:hypothetical protein